ncbi:hypothetical protein D3C75_636410 [compost metagenome]
MSKDGLVRYAGYSRGKSPLLSDREYFGITLGLGPGVSRRSGNRKGMSRSGMARMK